MCDDEAPGAEAVAGHLGCRHGAADPVFSGVVVARAAVVAAAAAVAADVAEVMAAARAAAPAAARRGVLKAVASSFQQGTGTKSDGRILPRTEEMPLPLGLPRSPQDPSRSFLPLPTNKVARCPFAGPFLFSAR